jgi:hypothetical protein
VRDGDMFFQQKKQSSPGREILPCEAITSLLTTHKIFLTTIYNFLFSNSYKTKGSATHADPKLYLPQRPTVLGTSTTLWSPRTYFAKDFNILAGSRPEEISPCIKQAMAKNRIANGRKTTPNAWSALGAQPKNTSTAKHKIKHKT